MSTFKRYSEIVNIIDSTTENFNVYILPCVYVDQSSNSEKSQETYSLVFQNRGESIDLISESYDHSLSFDQFITSVISARTYGVVPLESGILQDSTKTTFYFSDEEKIDDEGRPYQSREIYVFVNLGNITKEDLNLIIDQFVSKMTALIRNFPNDDTYENNLVYIEILNLYYLSRGTITITEDNETYYVDTLVGMSFDPELVELYETPQGVTPIRSISVRGAEFPAPLFYYNRINMGVGNKLSEIISLDSENQLPI